MDGSEADPARSGVMVLALADGWVWDFWLAREQEIFHLFYLHAPKTPEEPGRRHRAARIGHAVSTDLRSWTSVEGTIDVGAPGEFDSTATWTGCVVRDEADVWWMFYTGSRFLAEWPHPANIESVGVARSTDLLSWTKLHGPVVEANAQWYERLGDSSWPEEAWRDPWVFRGADHRWHMLLTARSNRGAVDERGVIGHAVSDDLVQWTVTEPLTDIGMGFEHMEVPQVFEVDGRWVLIFSCPTSALSSRRRSAGDVGGIWSVPIDADALRLLGEPRLLHGESLYSGRVVEHGGALHLLGFHTDAADGSFIGTISDPIPLVVDDHGYAELAEASERTALL